MKRKPKAPRPYTRPQVASVVPGHRMGAACIRPSWAADAWCLFLGALPDDPVVWAIVERNWLGVVALVRGGDTEWVTG